MKVTKWTTRVLQTPADNPLVVGIDQPGTREFVTLELDTDEGLQGIGVTLISPPGNGSNPKGTNSIAAAFTPTSAGASPTLPW